MNIGQKLQETNGVIETTLTDVLQLQNDDLSLVLNDSLLSFCDVRFGDPPSVWIYQNPGKDSPYEAREFDMTRREFEIPSLGTSLNQHGGEDVTKVIRDCMSAWIKDTAEKIAVDDIETSGGVGEIVVSDIDGESLYDACGDAYLQIHENMQANDRYWFNGLAHALSNRSYHNAFDLIHRLGNPPNILGNPVVRSHYVKDDVYAISGAFENCAVGIWDKIWLEKLPNPYAFGYIVRGALWFDVVVKYPEAFVKIHA